MSKKQAGVLSFMLYCVLAASGLAEAAEILAGINLSAPTMVAAGGSAQIRVAAIYKDTSTGNLRVHDVTKEAILALDSDAAKISQSGIIEAKTGAAEEMLINLTASYMEGGVSKSASGKISIIVFDGRRKGSHASRILQFEGTKTCLKCHPKEAKEMHASIHYQWRGDSSAIWGTDGKPAGKLGSLDDFCIFPDINWLGQIKNQLQVEVESGCAKCHSGLGLKPDNVATQEQLENIDCLLCHSDSYRRKVVMTGKGYRFVPDEEKIPGGILAAATDLRLPSKDACLNCHSASGGANNAKRGDLEEMHRNPISRSFDIHMSPKSLGGQGFDCLNCHRGKNHKILGRGTDLKPTDSPEPLTCTKCHAKVAHRDPRIASHLKRINCTACHITAYAKVAPTDMERDWSKAPIQDNHTKLFAPAVVAASNLTPEYRFFNGQSNFYRFGDPAVAGKNGRIDLSSPEGTVNDQFAQINAFKRHLGNQPVDYASRKLLPVKMDIFQKAGDLNQAVKVGTEEVGWKYTGYEFAATERLLGLFHEVSPKEQALTCDSCHYGSNRMNFEELGYKPNQHYDNKPLCASCHSDRSDFWPKTELFTRIHIEHVDRQKFDCNKCHNFSTAN